LLFGVFATTVYNPVSANFQERSRRLEQEIMFGLPTIAAMMSNLWITQITAEGQSIINANGSAGQGELLTGVTIFRFNPDGSFKERIEAQRAVLESQRWRLEDVRRVAVDDAPVAEKTAFLSTNLSADQVRESFATPETVSFWQLPEYIASKGSSGLAVAGYKLQYQKLLARPFLMMAMVLLAAAVSLRFFRFGGVQKMVLSGIAAGFLLYVLSKVTEDLSKAELMHPIAAAWLPVLVGGLTGFMALLYQEDG
jgi:lipopolysaccharide export system permease protein